MQANYLGVKCQNVHNYLFSNELEENVYIHIYREEAECTWLIITESR